MFLDRVKIWVRAGDGGDGAATFRQEAHVPRGGPDGGDGGRGGSVYLRVDAGQTTLRDFGFRHHFKATPGGRGSKARRHGKAGTDLYLEVPPGTAIYDDDTGELIGDLVAVGQETMVARGGRGGLGNTHFKTSTHQAPKHAQKGEPGDRALAPAGAPAHRRHRPRRAAERGQVHAAGRPHRGDAQDRRLPVHDPRTQPGRHGPRRRGRAAADDRRCARASSKAPATAPAWATRSCATWSGPGSWSTWWTGPAAIPAWDFDVIREELRAHDPALLEKPMLIAFNKMDQPAAAEAVAGIRDGPRGGRASWSRPSRRSPATGLDAFRARIAAMLPDAAGLAEPPEPSGVVVHRISAMGDGFLVELEEAGVFRVRGARIERIANQTNFDVEESAERFQRDLSRLGVDAELRRAGIETGDLVRIGGAELEWGRDPWEER